MASFPVERRKYKRTVFPSTLEYEIKTDLTGERFKGVAINISESGLCLYTSDFLKEGQEIDIMSVLPVSGRTAAVRWTRRLNEDICKVGLMFVS